jgi:uncharacterized protein YggE
VTFTVTRRGPTSAKAVALASDAYDLLDRALTGAGDVVARRTTVALSVYPVSRWDPETGKEISEGFEASRSETVRFAPPSESGEALRSITLAVTEISLFGPSYGLDPSNPVHAAVRADAAAEARRSAAAYASGLGMALGAVRSLTEPGLGNRPGDGYGGAPMPEMMKAMARDSSGGGATPALVELTDQDVEVTAVVEIDLALVDPAT